VEWQRGATAVVAQGWNYRADASKQCAVDVLCELVKRLITRVQKWVSVQSTRMEHVSSSLDRGV